MKLDIYRDQKLDRCLIVKRGIDIKNFTSEKTAFMSGLKWLREIDTDVDKLPAYLDKDVVLAIEVSGYHAFRDGPDGSIVHD